jgi:hypothetical protein
MRLITQLTVASLAVGGVAFWSGAARASNVVQYAADTNGSDSGPSENSNSGPHPSGDKAAGSNASADDRPQRSAADSPTTQPTTQPMTGVPSPGTGDTKSNPPAPGTDSHSPAIPPTNPPDPSVGGSVHTNGGSK